MNFSEELQTKIKKVGEERLAQLSNYSPAFQDTKDWKGKLAREVYWAIVCQVGTPEGKELGAFLTAYKAKETTRQVRLVIFA